jgi:hypothetical protein
MTTSSKFKDLKKNIFFITNLVIVSNLINYYLSGEKLYDKEWLYSSFAILITYIIYILVVNDYVNIEDKDYLRKRMKMDAIRYFVIFTISHLLTNYLVHGSFKASGLWLVQTIITVFFYVIFDYIFSDFVLKLNTYKSLFLDILKIFFAEILAMMITFQTIDLIDMSQLIAYIVSYLVWALIVKKLI